MGITNYLNKAELNNLLSGSVNPQASSLVSATTNGIEGLPYQFMSSVDRRLDGTRVGRKFAEKIFGKMPLLFLTPCRPIFMDDLGTTAQDRENMKQFLLSGSTSYNDIIKGRGRYYSPSFEYNEYYQYLNVMLTAIAAYLNLFDEKILINGKEKSLGQINWAEEANNSFASYFSGAENVIFYLDGLNSISESFSNDTTESSIASQVNNFSDQANELKFLFGGSGAIGQLMESTKDAIGGATSMLSGLAETLGGGIIGSLADKGVDSVLDGGKISFPEIWSNSSYDRSYSIDIKLRSPDNDSLSIFLNVLKPYCKILALTLPKAVSGNPNVYNSPFLVKAFCKGMFSVDMGIISSVSVNKGAEDMWNVDGLPTQIDISIEIKDLYKSLAMSGSSGQFSGVKDKIINSVTGNTLVNADVVCNTAYMDFLANASGLNIGKMELGRRVEMMYYLTNAAVTRIPSNINLALDQAISKSIGRLYQVLN